MTKICIYQDEPSCSLKIAEILRFLTSLDIDSEDRGDLFDYFKIENGKKLDFESYIDSIRVPDIEIPLDSRLTESEIIPANIRLGRARENLLDAYWLQRKYHSLLYSDNSSGLRADEDTIHLIITGKLFGTFGTKRYHARVLLTGEPCMISTSGIVEAPARPREYYFAKAGFLAEGRDIAELDKYFEDRFVEYDSPKLTEIICSYILQLIKCKHTGNPFCGNNKCCLFNSHWQEEVLSLQYTNEICDDCMVIICPDRQLKPGNTDKDLSP